MKKLLYGLVLCGSLASADFIGASMGAGVWQQNIGGYVKTGDDINYMNKKSAETDGDTHTGNLGLSDEKNPYVWAKIIHPIPLIPNIKLQYTKYDTKGKGIVTSNFEIFGHNIPLMGEVKTEIKINSIDATFFYEMKPVVADIEAGVGVNILQGTTDVKTLISSDSEDWTVPLPFIYARVETMNIAGFSVEAQGKYLNVSVGHYYDYQGAIKYHLPLPLIDISASIGYKKQDIYGEDGDNSTKIKFDGGFAELGVKW